MYSQNVEELLRRRKVYREIIFKYLAAQGVAVPPSSEKHLLIERVRQLWSGQLTARASEPRHRKPAQVSECCCWKSSGSPALLPQDDSCKCGSVERSQIFLTLGWCGFSWFLLVGVILVGFCLVFKLQRLKVSALFSTVFELSMCGVFSMR